MLLRAAPSNMAFRISQTITSLIVLMSGESSATFERRLNVAMLILERKIKISGVERKLLFNVAQTAYSSKGAGAKYDASVPVSMTSQAAGLAAIKKVGRVYRQTIVDSVTSILLASDVITHAEIKYLRLIYRNSGLNISMLNQRLYDALDRFELDEILYRRARSNKGCNENGGRSLIQNLISDFYEID